jgi:hypothetical protein
VGLGGGDLAEEEAEAADSESDSHEAEAGADPGQESSLGGEVDARVLFGGLGWIGHGGIVRQRQRVQVSGAGCRKLWFSWWYVVVGLCDGGECGHQIPPNSGIESTPLTGIENTFLRGMQSSESSFIFISAVSSTEDGSESCESLIL